jgi:AraC-like DNA-binding protein
MSRTETGAVWTVAQTAQALGVSEKTVYRRIKSGQLKARLEGQPPNWIIEPVDISGHGGGHASRQQYICSGEAGDGAILTIEILREQLGEKDRQIAELHVLLREAHGQMERLLPAPQEEAQGAKARHWWWPF